MSLKLMVSWPALKRLARAALPVAWAGLTLSACASLPDIDHTAAAATPTVVTSNGNLSHDGAQKVVDRVAGAAADGDILRKHVAHEEAVSGQPLIAGNTVLLHRDGPATYAAMFSAIRRARDHINLETYIFEADGAGTQLRDLLARKQRAGVQVNIIYDSVGSLRTPKDFFAPLRAAGAQVLEFNPVNPLKLRKKWRLNRRDHRKILVVDGKIAFTGGVNISDVYSKSSNTPSSSSGSDKKDGDAAAVGPWRDTHAELHGPAVAELQRLFHDTWRRQQGPALPARQYFPELRPTGTELVRVIASTPEAPAREIYRALASAVQHADRSVHITNAYFVPGRDLVKALKRAAARGVDVKIVLPSYTDSSLVFHAGRSHYTALLRAGVKIYERGDAMLHAKTVVVDGVWSSVGSANFDLRSFLHNDEVSANVVGADFAAKMEALFAQDVAASTRVDLAQWQRRPLGDRAREWLGRLMQYWL